MIKSATVLWLLNFIWIGVQAHAASIVENSPFLPPDFKPPTAAPQTASNKRKISENHLEFKGVYQLNGKYYFSIYDKRSKKAQWLNLHTPGDGVKITRFDSDTSEITIDLDGRQAVLSLASSSDVKFKPAATSKPAKQKKQVTPPQRNTRRTVSPPTRRVRPASTPSRRTVNR